MTTFQVVHEDDHIVVCHGDCLEIMTKLPDNSVDSVVTDPPYALSFMSKDWDKSHPDPRIWKECFRLLKPGGHLLSFGGTRTWHRLCCDIEDAGFEIRDSIAWLYGNGFPKGLDVSKAIDKAAGAEREVVGTRKKLDSYGEQPGNSVYGGDPNHDGLQVITAPTTDAAKQWAGWSTALKPSHEPIIMARKPLAGGSTVAANVLKHGTGALNIDACRVGDGERVNAPVGNKPGGASLHMSVVGLPQDVEARTASGRWPTNVVLDNIVAAELDRQSGVLTSGKLLPHHADNGKNAGAFGAYTGASGRESYGDSGGASRFFPVFKYQSKAPTRERPSYVDDNGKKISHSTVKPVELIRWLLRLVTPSGGVVLDPFAGSGTLAEAVLVEDAGHCAILIEKEEEYLPLINARIERVS